jgi:hypothetical protein
MLPSVGHHNQTQNKALWWEQPSQPKMAWCKTVSMQSSNTAQRRKTHKKHHAERSSLHRYSVALSAARSIGRGERHGLAVEVAVRLGGVGESRARSRARVRTEVTEADKRTINVREMLHFRRDLSCKLVPVQIPVKVVGMSEII